MNKQIITEAALTAPTFNGSDEDIAQATQCWASLVSSLSYCLSGTCSAENKKAMLSAMACYVQCKMDEVNNVTTPPVVAQGAPAFVPVSVPAVAVPTAPEAPADSYTDAGYADSYREAKEEVKQPIKEAVNPILKRMRELAGIPHETNRV